MQAHHKTDRDPLCWLQAALIVSILCIGLLSALVGFRINGDGVSYIDIAEAYARGDWRVAVNAYWSPLYSWVLAAFFAASWPPAPWEYFFVELVNFLIFGFGFVAYWYFLRRLIGFRRLYLVEVHPSDSPFDRIFSVVGLCLFAWVAIEWINVRLATPDWCVAALVFVAAGLLLKIATRPHASGAISFLFGVVIAGAYLAKAAMFPLGLCFLATLPFLGGERRQIVRRVTLAFIGFFILAGPWILVLSLSKDRLTYGDVARLNYAWYVNGSPGGNRHWQGDLKGVAEPMHATRKLHNSPPVFEFASPIHGTYPPWYDPSYWNEGIQTTFDVRQQMDRLFLNLKWYFSTAYRIGTAPFLIVLLLFGACSGRLCRLPRNVLAFWPLLLPSLAAFVLYALVHVELRFLGAFALIVLMSAFASTEPVESSLVKRVLAVALALLLLSGPLRPGYLLGEVREDVSAILGGKVKFDPYRDISEGLLAIGVRAGDKIAVIGANSSPAVWARRARVKIVAEIPSYSRMEYWEADTDSRRQVLKLFSQLNVSAVIARRVPEVLPLEEGWMRIPNSDLYVVPRGETTEKGLYVD